VSRGVVYDPVSTNQSTDLAARPTMLQAVSVAYDPVCRQFTGTQTATPDIPPTN